MENFSTMPPTEDEKRFARELQQRLPNGTAPSTLQLVRVFRLIDELAHVNVATYREHVR